MREITIGKNDAGQRLDRFVSKSLPLLPPALLQKYIRLKRIKCNGARAQRDQRLQEGDVLQLYINDEFFDKPREDNLFLTLFKPSLDIVYEDEDLLVINKAAGMPIHPSLHNYDNSLGNALAWYFRQKNTPFVFRCINRLDRDTSGLTIVAKHMVSGAILGQQVAAKSLQGEQAEGISREYYAIVKGKVTPSAGVIDAPIGRKESSCLERMIDFEHGDRAVTHYRVVAEANGHSLLALVLETGRTHQIRVHLAWRSHPIVGDMIYGHKKPELGLNSQCLHAAALDFIHPRTGKPVHVECELPDYFTQALSKLEPL